MFVLSPIKDNVHAKSSAAEPSILVWKRWRFETIVYTQQVGCNYSVAI